MNISLKLATIIKNADPKRTHSIEVMQYALSILLNTFFVCLIVLTIGWTTGTLLSTLIALTLCIILRMVSGGVHLKKVWTCNIFSIIVCAGVPHLPVLSIKYIIILNFFSLIMMILFAPYQDKNTRLPQKILPVLKGISIFLVLGNFFIFSNVVVLVCLVQSLTIIPWRREVSTI
jgi:accessory gene regulator B